MSGRKRASLSPSLFPFLAVLVCTLGTLILLLALVAQKAVDAKITENKHPTPPTSAIATSTLGDDPPGLTVSTVSAMIEEQQFLVDQYVSFREEQTGEIEERRDKIAHVEAHLSRIREDLARLNKEVETAMAEDASSRISETDIQAVDQNIAKKERELELLREKGKHKNPRVVIVPYKGPNGTDRRPIYLECTSRGLLIWPEKSIITTETLSHSTSGANPLDAALRVIRNHVMSTYGDAAPPYPLLIVRPDGISTYIAARGAMLEYDDQFGYELVPGGVQLALPKADRALKSKVETAIAEAINMQNRHSIIAQRNNYREQRRLPVLSAAALDRQGRTNGYSASSRNLGSSFGMNESQSSLNAARQYAQTGRDRGRPSSSRSSTTPVDQGRPSGHRQSNDSFNQSSSEPIAGATHAKMARSTATWDSSANQVIDPARMQKWNDDLESAAQELRGSGSSLDQASEQASSEWLEHLSDPASSEQTFSDSSRSAPDQPTSDRSVNGGFSSRAGTSPKMPDGRPPQSQSGQTDSMQATSQPSQPGSPPPPNLDPSSERWVLPPNVSLGDGNALIRKLRADCYADGFVLNASRAVPEPQSFAMDLNNTQQAMMELAAAIKQRIERWGVALPGGYWSPQLEVSVHPGSEKAFERFEQLMRRSGVEVIAKQPSTPTIR